MKICNLASSSSGNCTYVQTNKYKFLIDIGRTKKYIVDSLKSINVDYHDIDFVFLTHTHDDHVSALHSFMAGLNAKLVITRDQFKQLKDLDGINCLIYDENPVIEGLNIRTYKMSHDAGDTRAFLITEEKCSLVYITDTGYINSKYFNEFTNKTVYYIESNHDVEMLTHGPYPKFLQARVLSDEGHLSNKFTGIYLSKIIGSETRNIALLHLSDKNNNPDIALNTIKEYIDVSNIDLFCTNKDQVSKVVEI